ncbi:hypothetical protein DFA_10321 [Cavenderia fasciculata]|uniref:Zinc-binding loop region of homing endonuclease domain-containing protein n=1 Tax=Cavenderia fasciculata TaxID=261658 RepID=F4Q9W3_CACFS|nr:uncharacterized protein DFA_10321 [Cavenderia fasciculata]EGG15482.1 hypothetical protein DFA_10321 [Cavenderia fasciculata]|eukprot:XP_004354224.1 hypothetical protein DFA_10321 [Cavenderia fasciculata]
MGDDDEEPTSSSTAQESDDSSEGDTTPVTKKTRKSTKSKKSDSDKSDSDNSDSEKIDNTNSDTNSDPTIRKKITRPRINPTAQIPPTFEPLDVSDINESQFTKLKGLLNDNKVLGDSTFNSSRCEVYPDNSFYKTPSSIKPQHVAFMAHRGRLETGLIPKTKSPDNMCISKLCCTAGCINKDHILSETHKISKSRGECHTTIKDILKKQLKTQDRKISATIKLCPHEPKCIPTFTNGYQKDESEEEDGNQQQTVKRKRIPKEKVKSTTTTNKQALKKTKYPQDEVEVVKTSSGQTIINVTMHSQNVFIMADNDNFGGVINRLVSQARPPTNGQSISNK